MTTMMHASERTRRSWPMLHLLPTALAAWLVGTLFVTPAVAQNAEWGIFVMKTDGSQVRMLAQIDGCKRHSCPRWSHDGKRVVFSASPGSPRESAIYVANADGSGLKKIAEQARADWSPDDKQIAFDFYPRGGGQREIFVQNVDGQGRTRIGAGASPRWSPDGSRIAVRDQGNVYVIDLVTGETRALFRQPFNRIYEGMAWFADGQRLAVVVRPEPRKHRQLLFVSAQGEEQGVHCRLESELGGFISFSPNGKKLVIDNAYKVHIVEVEGTSEPVTLKGQRGANTESDWSPDGEWIVFASSRDPI